MGGLWAGVLSNGRRVLPVKVPQTEDCQTQGGVQLVTSFVSACQ